MDNQLVLLLPLYIRVCNLQITAFITMFIKHPNLQIWEQVYMDISSFIHSNYRTDILILYSVEVRNNEYTTNSRIV